MSHDKDEVWGRQSKRFRKIDCNSKLPVYDVSPEIALREIKIASTSCRTENLFFFQAVIPEQQ